MIPDKIGIVSTFQVLRKISQRAHIAYNIRNNLLVSYQDICKRKFTEIAARPVIQKFPERESFEVVNLGNVFQIVVSFKDPQNRRAAEDELQSRKFVITLTQFVRPIRVFVDLIQHQNFSSPFVKLVCKGEDTSLGEVEVVKIYIKAIARIAILFADKVE